MTSDELRREIPGKHDAWYDGYMSGRADKLLGYRLDVAIYPDRSTYSSYYCQGYRAGQRNTYTWEK